MAAKLSEKQHTKAFRKLVDGANVLMEYTNNTFYGAPDAKGVLQLDGPADILDVITNYLQNRPDPAMRRPGKKIMFDSKTGKLIDFEWVLKTDKNTVKSFMADLVAQDQERGELKNT